MEQAEVLIIGGGIVGLAHAVSAQRRGLSVALLERSPEADGASLRNFGMVLPIAQTSNRNRWRAMQSRLRWHQLSREAGFRCEPCGMLFVAYVGDEMAVLREFVEGDGTELDCRLLEPAEALQRCNGLVPDGLVGGMWSPHDLAVDPREAVPALTQWLAAQPGVAIHTNETVVTIEKRVATTMSGKQFEGERIFVCSGADTESLYPEVYENTPVTKCKLQMMRTAPQPDGWRLGSHLATGLTIRHYRAFASCPSWKKVYSRVAEESPEYNRFGIHVMATQNGAGELVIGDSHEYGEEALSEDKRILDALIIDYLAPILKAPDMEPVERWSSTYLQRTDSESDLVREVAPGVRIVNALGGSGMTLSFALAEEQFQN